MFKYILPLVVFFAFFNFNTPPPNEPYEFLHTEHSPSPIPNLCIVNSGLYPLVQAGGIQKAFTHAMLDFLYSKFVYHIDVIYPSPISLNSQNNIIQWWAKHSNNITFHFTSNHINDYGSSRMINAIRVYDIYRRLKCSAVLSHEYEAPTYYIQVSRPTIPVFIWAHSQHLYTDRMNMRFPKSPMAATVYSMEKYVLEKATTVFAPSYWYIHWMRNNHINLPMTYRIANPNTKMPEHVILLPNHSNHFIFYSRVEPLKGIHHFLHIANHFCHKATFTIIGITKNIPDSPCIEYKTPPKFQTVLDNIKSNSIVLGLSLADTSSYTLLEMFQHKIPFITNISNWRHS
jgi:glycosyltransferase involved in cell wall biosynthesis